MKVKWDYQEGWSTCHILLDELEFKIWKHIHWAWWGWQSILQFFRDIGNKWR